MDSAQPTRAHTVAPPAAPPPSVTDLAEVAELGERLRAALARSLQGKDAAVATTVATFLAGGHLLIEDVPGVGKTTLAKALARAIDAPMRRIQFTPDLLPSDITGVSIFDAERRRFEFRPGAIFATVVVCDEINRASPKTQSAVLESMEEAQVTVDGQTHPLGAPFFVVATQNPLEMEGTYPLPEAQRDRFMTRISLGYPDRECELAMLERHAADDPLASATPVADASGIARAITVTRGVHAGQALRGYIVDLVRATRENPALRLGASPRAALHLLRAARAAAALAGRDHVLPRDVRDLAGPVLAHRMLESPASRLARVEVRDVVADLVDRVPPPPPDRVRR